MTNHDQKHPFDLPRDPGKRARLRESRYARYGPRAFSASSLRDLIDCPRLWWFKRVARLRTPMSPAAELGVIHHAVLERYLSADDRGRDETGMEALLYPEGWHVTKHFGPLAIAQQQMIRGLVRKAVEQGVIARSPGRLVEAEFWWPGDPDARTMVHGYADLVLPRAREVVDHKTSSGTRWLLTPNRLAADTQMLVYGEMLRVLCDGPGPVRSGAAELGPEHAITLTHNQFVFAPERPEVRKTSCQILTQGTSAHWEGTVRRAAGEIDRLAGVADYAEVPEAPAPTHPGGSSHCRKYGGCAFLEICFGPETPETYARATAEKEAFRRTQENRNPRGEDTMTAQTALERLRALTTSVAPPPAGPTPLLAVVLDMDVAAPSPEAPPKRGGKKKNSSSPEPFTKPTAPWASMTCGGCRGDATAVAGMKAAGNGPCVVCRVRQEKDGRPSDRDFNWTLEDGTLSWTVKEEMRAAVVEALGESACEGCVGVPEPSVSSREGAAPDRGEQLDLPLIPDAPDSAPDPVPNLAPNPAPDIPGEKFESESRTPWPFTEVDPDSVEEQERCLEWGPANLSSRHIEGGIRSEFYTAPSQNALTEIEITIEDLCLPRWVADRVKERGRRPASFTLYIGAIPVEGVTRVVSVARVLDVIGTKFYPGGYYSAPYHPRRKAVMAFATGLTETLKGTHVVVGAADLANPDIACLVSVLRALASSVVVAHP